jgi:hypothetical protein
MWTVDICIKYLHELYITALQSFLTVIRGPSATAAIRQMGGAAAGEMRAQFKRHANVKKRVLD